MFAALTALSALAAPPRLVVAPVGGTFESADAERLRAGIKEAEAAGALRHVLVEIQLSRAASDALMLLGDALFELRTRGVTTVAFIVGGSETAPSTLLACACKEIALGPGARLGGLDALALGEENRKKVLAWAEAFGRAPRLAARMFDTHEALGAYHFSDPDKWLLLSPAAYEALAEAVRAKAIEKKDLCKEGESLMLDPGDTLKYTIARDNGFLNYRPDGRDDLFVKMSLVALKDEEIKDLGARRIFGGAGAPGMAFAEFCQSSIVRFVLILVGLLCLFLEFQAPGVGIPGLVSLLCFGVFFGTGLATGYADYWELGLFIVGCLLIALELFAFPGFAVTGILGVVCVLVSLVLGMIKNDASQPLAAGDLLGGVMTTLLGCVCAAAGMAVLARLVPKSRFVGRVGIVHRADIAGTSEGTDGAGASGKGASSWPIGAVGVAESMLRPAGKARFGDKLLDVVAESVVIAAGTPVIVVKKVGPMTVVREHGRSENVSDNG
jgi:membrane-bound serine protease (ClpP class)